MLVPEGGVRASRRRPAVRMTGITVSFPGALALDRVDLSLRAGEVHAVMGQNGAGKSTLIKTLTGLIRADAGEIVVDGVPRRFASAADARAAGIATVFQEFELCPNLSIGENVMLGQEVRRGWRIDWSATHRRAGQSLALLGLGDLDPRGRMLELPPAVQQLIAISRAMVGDPRVLVLDEPTSSLDEREVSRLLDVLRRLRVRGVAILFVSHFLEQVFAISDRITVLRNGRVEGRYRTDEIDRPQLVARMIGKDIEALRRIGSERSAYRREPTGAPVLRAEGLGRRGSLGPLDLDLHRGEVVGVAGLRGSGRTELAHLLAGVSRADHGRVQVAQRPARLSSPARALRLRIALSTEDRRVEGIVPHLSMADNILLALQALRGWARPISRAERADIVARYVDLLGIVPADPHLPAEYLSGGNQQKVLLARWLATRPAVLILDEPTRGVDIASKVDLQTQIARLAQEGMAIVFISSELDEVVRLSDRIVVLKDHEKIGELSNGPAVSVDSVVELIAADPAEG